MKLFIRNSILVAIILLAIYGVLRLGQGLTAPAAIHGDWRMPITDPGCPALLNWEDPAALYILQSGLYLDMQLGGHGGLSLSGRLDGAQIQAQGAASLHLTLNRSTEPAELSGELNLPGCEPLPVTYQQAPTTQLQGEGYH